MHDNTDMGEAFEGLNKWLAPDERMSLQVNAQKDRDAFAKAYMAALVRIGKGDDPQGRAYARSMFNQTARQRIFGET